MLLRRFVMTYQKVMVSWRNQNSGAAPLLQWGWQLHYMPLPMPSSGELLPLLLELRI